MGQDTKMKKLVHIAIVVLIQHLTFNIHNSIAQSPHSTPDNTGAGNGLNFNRSGNDHVLVNNAASLNFGNGSFTVETWFRLKQTIAGSGQNHVLISKGKPANTNTSGYMLRFHWSTGLAAIYSDASGTGGFYATAPSNYDDGNWHHAAAVFDKAGTGNMILYVDGVNVASTSIAAEGVPDNAVNLSFGNALPSEDPVNSYMDEVRIWNIARTQTQVRDNMNKKLTGSETGLVGYWDMNEGTGNTVSDLTSNANHGTRQ